MGYQNRPSMGSMGPSQMMGPGGGMNMGPGPGGMPMGGQYMGPSPGGPRMMGSGMGMGGGPRMMGGPGGGMGGGNSGGMGGPGSMSGVIGPGGGSAGMGMGSPGMVMGSPGGGGSMSMGTNMPDGAGGPGPGPAPVPTSSSGDTGPPAGAPQVSSPAPQPVAQQSKSDVNASTVCRIGQETVEEIVSRTQEVFSILKSLQPPVGSYNPQTVAHDKSNQDKQSRLQDVLKGIGMLFKRLRVCWEKCQENTGGMDFLPIESLIPLKEDGEGRVELEKKRGDAYKSAAEEHNELVQQITLKNRHLKDVIDQMRNIIWEINTMLAIRKA